ncbi:Gamma-aminobutyric acid receptor subunit beta-2 [Holothuria leucospilota]|uniref:Gamma-aminobutyric acid receptor subunit beta-2 n=1 Tax=Holothuria leucospilota TaxID=206669 RepID=A0A9Q1H6Q7_HOLLE|nr:Gamma-aminobutyric acid receptor subunit beta-2 [Holothuria leucospilota]
MPGLSEHKWRTESLSLLRRLEGNVQQLEMNSHLLASEVWHQPREMDEKVECKVKCVVRSVGEIDTVKQTFEAEVSFLFGWREEKFQGRESQDIALDEYWDPRIYFPNAVTIDERERKHFIQYHDDETVPYAYLSIRMKATFKSVMQLQNFPLDHQVLTIKVMSNWPESMIQFEQVDQDENNIYTSSFTETHEWTLHNRLTVDSANNEETYGYPMHIIQIYVTRKISYYMWNVALVTLLILLSNFTSFAVSPSAPEDRLSVSVTLLLTAVAFKSVVSSSLPKIPYLTLMDKYVLWSLIIQCLVVLQNAIAVIFAEPNTPNEQEGNVFTNLIDISNTSKIFDYCSILVLSIAMFTLNVYFIVRVLIRKKPVFQDPPKPLSEPERYFLTAPTVKRKLVVQDPPTPSSPPYKLDVTKLTEPKVKFMKLRQPTVPLDVIKAAPHQRFSLPTLVTSEADPDNIHTDQTSIELEDVGEETDQPVITEEVTEEDIP